MDTTENLRKKLRGTEKKQRFYYTMVSSDDPCSSERTMSVSCLSEARGDPEKCELEIQNYNNCKDFWHIITLERKSAKTSPSIPDEHERDSIFKARFPDFLNSKGRSRRVYHNNSNS